VFIGLSEDGEVLEYFGPGEKPLWSIPVKDIVLLAEYMTNGGWWGDDSDLMIVTAERGDFYSRSAIMESAGMYMVLKRLENRWKSSLGLELGPLTLWSSRILWPAELAGQEYFEFRDAQPRTLLERLPKVAFGDDHEYQPCKTVRDFLARSLPPRDADPAARHDIAQGQQQ
jgi:hypothetical protein